MSLNIFSVPGLIAWLEGQDPKTQYDFTDAANCLIQRYLKDRGVDVPAGGYTVNTLQDWGFCDIASGNTGDETYGAALDRAKEMINAT